MSGILVVCTAVAGIAAGVWKPIAIPQVIAVAIGAASLSLASVGAAVRLPTPSDRRVSLAFVFGLMALSAVGAAYGSMARQRALEAPLATWFEHTFGADTIRAETPTNIRGWLANDASVTVDGIRLDIDVEAVAAAGSDAWQSMTGRVRLYVAGVLASGAAPEWSAGRHIRTVAHLRRPTMFRNFGGSDAEIEVLRRPFTLAGSIKSAALVEVAPGSLVAEASAALRRRIRTVLHHYVAGRDPPAAAVMAAILIGDRAGLDDELELRLQRAGTYHVIAISGGNVALVAAGAFVCARLFTRRRVTATLAALILVLAYGCVVEGDASVRRAVLAAVVYLLVDLTGLLPSPRHVLALVALVLVLADPRWAIDIGAWLSFGATAAIVIGVPRLLAHIPAQRPLSRALITIVVATMAVEVVLWPIQAAVFGRLTVAGLLLNLVAIPAMAVVQVAGIALVALAGFWDGAAIVAAAVARVAVRTILESSALVDVVPWVTWRVPPVAPAWAVAYAAGWAVILNARRGVVRKAGAVVSGVSAVVIATAPWATTAGTAAPWIRATLLDVGQGDAVLVQWPSGHSLLVDAGGARGVDVGARVIVPAVWALGIRRLDWWVMTHGDGDHVGGARAVLRDLRPREVWEGVPVPGHREREAIRRESEALGMVWRTVRQGHRIDVAGSELTVMWPQPPEWERRRVRNDDSVVLKLVYGEVELLLTGDAGGEFEAQITGEEGARRLRVLKVAHHGSRTSTSEGFIEAQRPDVALISVGGANLFGHPSPEVMTRLDAARAAVFRTDKNGAISVETDGRRVCVRTVTGEHWQVERWEVERAPPGRDRAS